MKGGFRDELGPRTPAHKGTHPAAQSLTSLSSPLSLLGHLLMGRGLHDSPALESSETGGGGRRRGGVLPPEAGSSPPPTGRHPWGPQRPEGSWGDFEASRAGGRATPSVSPHPCRLITFPA